MSRKGRKDRVQGPTFAEMVTPGWMTLGLCLALIVFTGVTIVYGLVAGLIAGVFLLFGLPPFILQAQLMWGVWFTKERHETPVDAHPAAGDHSRARGTGAGGPGQAQPD